MIWWMYCILLGVYSTGRYSSTRYSTRYVPCTSTILQYCTCYKLNTNTQDYGVVSTRSMNRRGLYSSPHKCFDCIYQRSSSRFRNKHESVPNAWELQNQDECHTRYSQYLLIWMAPLSSDTVQMMLSTRVSTDHCGLWMQVATNPSKVIQVQRTNWSWESGIGALSTVLGVHCKQAERVLSYTT